MAPKRCWHSVGFGSQSAWIGHLDIREIDISWTAGSYLPDGTKKNDRLNQLAGWKSAFEANRRHKEITPIYSTNF